jgi:predicted dinucleotide-binding enzyme
VDARQLDAGEEIMATGKKIGVLGTGPVGQTIAAKLAELGHAVFVGTRDPAETLARTNPDMFGNPPFAVWREQHPKVQFGTLAQAAAHGEIVVNATSGGGSLAALEAAGAGNLAGKVVIDLANPLDFSRGMPPSLTVCNTDSLGEQLQRAFPAARVVKTLNTMNAYLMVGPDKVAGADHTVFVSGNDAAAKQTVSELLRSFGWKDILDLGDITTARGTEMILPIWVRIFAATGSPMFQLKVVR